MISIGKVNPLKVVKILPFGIYLDAFEKGEILMPTQYVPANTKVGDIIDAFIYLDSEDKLIATTEIPYAQINEFAYLQVVAVNQIGAFVDWGLPKNLLVPFREQKLRLKQGEFAWVYIYLDEQTQRIAASAKIEKFFSKDQPPFVLQDKVEVLIYKKTDLGYKVIVNQMFDGMIFANEIFQDLQTGQKHKAYIKKIREDGKIDLTLYKTGYNQVVDFSAVLLDAIKNAKGYLALHDKSSAEEIYQVFGVSKKVFKKAVGDLYKKQLIRIESDGLYLLT
ncbi:MAG: GntR family transcriptional regulator [Bacteroidales bacterium]|nr:GntR family transcriptional regulator [Bacteroidales bacterium]